MTYNLLGLSPEEFEIFGADFLRAKLGLRFELFAAGRDGGMDGRHRIDKGDIIMQAKRYSAWKNLVAVMRKEKEKIHRLRPIDYWLLTTVDLNPDQKDELVSLIGHRSVTAERIMGLKDLQLLLSKEEYRDVVLSNGKLWMTSAIVLDHLVNAAVHSETQLRRDQIERAARVYVPHPGAKQAEAILDKRHALILTGPPGVGKTTLAQFMAARLVESGWRLVAINNIADAHVPAGNDQVVYLYDEFLGTGGVDERDLGRTSSRILLRFQNARCAQNVRIIMTTRAMQFDEAMRLSEPIGDDDVTLTRCHVDLRPFSRGTKSRILYNHLFRSGLQSAHILAIIPHARDIVDHQNFLPRLIADVTRAHNNEDLSPQDYVSKVMRTLSDPTRTWHQAFENQISAQARVLLLCMMFYRPFIVEQAKRANDLRTFFEAAAPMLLGSEVNILNLNFKRATQSLENSFIINTAGVLSFINPSVRDYLETAVTAGMLLSLGSATPDLATARQIWQFAKRNKGTSREALAVVLQQRIARPFNRNEGVLSDCISFVTELYQVHPSDAFEEDLMKILPPLDLLIGDIPSALEASSVAELAGLASFAAVARDLVGVLNRFLLAESEENCPDIGLLVDLVLEFCRHPSSAMRGGGDRADLAAQAFSALSRAVRHIRIPEIPGGEEQRLQETLEALESLPGELVQAPVIGNVIEALRNALVVVEVNHDAEIDSASLRIAPAPPEKFDDDDLQTLFASLREWAELDIEPCFGDEASGDPEQSGDAEIEGDEGI
ncbi:ATP-binding protein [Rhizobium leguminosarum]|uniref:ATP-binding protein n=1 Tax=Rhizobium leguminosarum TaxID=384 RepID=UPI0013D9E057|nr:ATP-binding protein [Rhizobium leguminosarum]NEK35615.1 hypothetical protein [Rhizobium leguminosarum]